ncbi:hypothetical protein ACYZT7_10415 [Pseudomonas sp. RT4P38]
MNVVIASHEDVLKARKLVTLFNRPRLHQVDIYVCESESSHDAQLAKLVIKHFNDCGCVWSGWAAMLTII